MIFIRECRELQTARYHTKRNKCFPFKIAMVCKRKEKGGVLENVLNVVFLNNQFS